MNVSFPPLLTSINPENSKANVSSSFAPPQPPVSECVQGHRHSPGPPQANGVVDPLGMTRSRPPIQPLNGAEFSVSFQRWCSLYNIVIDEALLTYEGRPTHLHMLHSAVNRAGGAQRVSECVRVRSSLSTGQLIFPANRTQVAQGNQWAFIGSQLGLGGQPGNGT